MPKTPIVQPRKQLIAERHHHRWTQQEVANRIGADRTQVERWELGSTTPSPRFRSLLCELFGKSAQELGLFGGPTVGEEHAFPVKDPMIPQLATHVVDRETLLFHLQQRLTPGAALALQGLPGVGKTALAAFLSYDPKIRKRFRDGVLWVGLGPRINKTKLLSRWGTLLDLEDTTMRAFDSDEERAQALRSVIGSHTLLIVIDDAWNAEDAMYFKIGGPRCAHLVTTRFPMVALDIAFEGVTTVHELSEQESMILLRQLAPAVVQYDEQGARELIRAVGGLPLALTLLGKHLGKLAYSRQPRRIATALGQLRDAKERLLVSEIQGPLDHHSSLSASVPLSLQAVIAVTIQQLAEQVREALTTLSSFPAKPETFTEARAEAVGCLRETLYALIDAGLVEVSGLDHYTLHPVIADYAQTFLARENQKTDKDASENAS